MKRTGKMNSHLSGFSSGASLGGKVSRYRRKQNIYKQGAPAYTLFYIQQGGVRLTTQNEIPAIRSYRHPGRRRSLRRALPRRLSPSYVHGRCFDVQLHPHHQ